MKNWDDYIEFENKKYGIEHIINNIHNTNNCGGKIIHTHYECHGCGKTFGFVTKHICYCETT